METPATETDRNAAAEHAARPCAYADCAKLFTPTRADARFCSPGCRLKAHRAQQKAPAPQTTPNTTNGSNVIRIDDKHPRKETKAERRAHLQELKAQADQAAREPAKRKVGAPTIYTEALAREICERVALRESLATICRDDHMPCERQVYLWQKKHPEFAQELARARADRAAARADRIDELVDMLTAGKLAPDAARVAIQAEQWQAGKEQPAVYSDRAQVDITSAGKPLASASDLDIAKALAHALAARALPAPEAIDVEVVPVPAHAQAEPDPYAEPGDDDLWGRP
jgi:hypothetical protein